MNVGDQARPGRPKAVLLTIEANLLGSVRRVSGELSIIQISAVRDHGLSLVSRFAELWLTIIVKNSKIRQASILIFWL